MLVHFTRNRTYTFRFQKIIFLSDAGKITLNFRYSENLDFDRSMITVFWGDVPIASKRLEKDKGNGGMNLPSPCLQMLLVQLLEVSRSLLIWK